MKKATTQANAALPTAASPAPENAADSAYAIVLAGHGSRLCEGVREFEALVELIRARAATRLVRHGYLEFVSPTLDVAVRDAVASGAHHIVMVPGVLFAATHAKNDMPSELLALRREFPAIRFSFGAALDLHPKLLQLCAQRVLEAEAVACARSGELVARSDACLAVVGRGTSDPDANADVSKLARMLEEGLGFGTSFVCYAGTAKPKVAEGLRAAARLGYRRLIVLPYFLFDGILVRRVNAAADALRARYPELNIVSAAHLGVHPHLADVFLERAAEGAQGHAVMNCALCKYRVQIVGFEQQVGAPQRSHQQEFRTAALARGADADGILVPQGGAMLSAQRCETPDHLKVRGYAEHAAALAPEPALRAYKPHPNEAESMRIIDQGRDWSSFSVSDARVLKRLVHTSGDFSIVDDIFISTGAVDIGMRALLRCRRIVTDVTMVQAGLKQALLAQLGIETWCGVHDEATHVLAKTHGLTRSAAGIRRAWERFGNDAIVAIGDAPTAVSEAVQLIERQGWRPQLLIGLPVGFVGTRECKEALRDMVHIPRITNRGTRGGSPWAAAVINALMISALDSLATSILTAAPIAAAFNTPTRTLR